MSLNLEVSAAIAQWRELGEPCQNRKAAIEDCWNCRTCGGTGYVQPTIVTAVIAALTTALYPHAECSKKRHCYVEHPDYGQYYKGRASCHGTGRVPRDWEEMPGALEGVLRHWYWKNKIETELGEFRISIPRSDSDALAAVVQVLVQMYGRKP